MGIVFIVALIVLLAFILNRELANKTLFNSRWGRGYTREENPIMYWTGIVFHFTILAVAIVMLILVLTAFLARH
jgi:hypothetical protein